ncbi:MAG: CDP-diacylglycerol---glycerol-3-phosphate 3-phosphatidyltransferase [Bacteroidota bacterium]|nr:CDP-diacylglycerol---glycerol-3-phosphate 3-phosphatidyltransferase [Bacteroidota bacterium]
MNLNLPNIITLIRIAISPVFFIFLISEDRALVQAGCFLFFFGAITDYIDGWLARKYHEISKWGKFLDPLADKFLTTAAFISFTIMGLIPLWMVIIIITRDLGTTLMRVYADSVNMPVATSYSAIVKTFVQMLFITVLLVLIYFRNSEVLHPDGILIDKLLHSKAVIVTMLILTLLTVWTAFEYIYKNKMLFIGQKR